MSDNIKYQCNICCKIFKQKIDFTRHNNKKNKCSKDEIRIEGKKVYKCNICDKMFDLKCNYMMHINRKNKCIKKNNIIESKNIDIINNDLNYDTKSKINEIVKSNIIINPQHPQYDPQNPPQNPQNILNKKKDDNICNNCNKSFSRIDSLKRHMIKCNITLIDNKIDIKIDDKIDDKEIKQILNEFKIKLSKQEDTIIQQYNLINELNDKIKNNNNTNIITSNSNNTTNITNNTINYVNHGKEDLSKLIKDEISEILNSGYSCIYKSIMYTHYNDRLPEFKNIKYSDPKSSYCEVFIDGSWKLVKFENTIEELINKHFYEVSDLYNDNKDLIESKFKEGLIEDYIGDYYKFISYEEEDKYPENWNKTMKREKQKKTRRRLNHNKDEIKTLIINKTISEKKSLIDKKSSINSLK